MKYLVDTNILIYLINSKSEKLEQKIRAHAPEHFGVSGITVAELIYGVFKSQRRKQNLAAIIKILTPFTILDFNTKDAWEYGQIRADLEKTGSIIGGNDLLIASQARRRSLTVVTSNIREYMRIKKLAVEDWMV